MPIRGFLLVCVCGVSDLRAYLRVAVRGGLCRCCENRQMRAYLAGAVEMRAYSRVAVAGWCRLAGDAFQSAGSRAWDGVGVRGNRQMRAYLVHAAQVRAHLPVSAAAPVRLLGFACLSCGCWPWGTAGTGGCGCISSVLWRCTPICRFLRLRPFGIPDLRVYLRDPVLSALPPALAKRPLPGHRPWHRANPNTRHHTSPVA